MPLSKEYLLQQLIQLEGEIDYVPAPKELSVQIPYFELLGLPPVPNPLTPENGKVYIIEFLTADLTIPLPTGVDPGFCFEVWAVECNNVGPYRVEVVAPVQLVLGDCIFGLPALADTTKCAIDGDGPSVEAVRFTFLGELDYTVAGAGIFDFWKMERLDGKSNVTKHVHYATAAALPAHTASGVGPDRVLTASGAGQLTVDGKTYTSIDREKILVKDEGDQDSNGVYWLTQVDPWVLRRASIDQNEAQVERRGANYQVWWGATNNSKQFFRKWYGSSIDPVAGGGGGGTTMNDVTVNSGTTPVTAVADTCYTCFLTTPQNLVFNLPAPVVGLKGKEIWFKARGSWSSTYYVRVQGYPIDGTTGYNLDTANELLKIRCVETNTPGTYEWVQVG